MITHFEWKEVVTYTGGSNVTITTGFSGNNIPRIGGFNDAVTEFGNRGSEVCGSLVSVTHKQVANAGGLNYTLESFDCTSDSAINITFLVK
jgi:hypothetical protein